MKILHTSDWHLGVKLHGHDLSKDHDLYFIWLLNLINKEEIDILLISGDIFDLANPSSEARKQYYEILVELTRLKCQVVITGGNHDSPSMLNAPKEVLKALNITVIGGYANQKEELIIPLKNKEGETKAVVAAIPFLRDSDLRKMVVGESYADRMESIREGIKLIFENAATQCKTMHPNIPALAMGHLYAQGAISSESERDIQIGNLAGFASAQFDTYFKYIALGHIHKPMDINKERNVIYSGSPIPLSFSEKMDKKRVVLITLDKELAYESIAIPETRKLLKIEGDLTKITTDLENIETGHLPLKTLIEVLLKEDDYNPGQIVAFESLLEMFDDPNAEIVKQKVQFKNQINGAASLYSEQVSIKDLKPSEVFLKRMETEEIDDTQRQLLEDAFSEILISMQQGEES